MSSSEDRRFCNNLSSSIIQRVPVEVLVIIFVYVGPPSAENPYVYFILSWVCQHWRSIVLDIPNFWTVIRYKSKSWSKNPEFVKKTFCRSESYPLDIFSCDDNCCHPDGCAARYVISESSRLRSLLVQNITLSSIGRWSELQYLASFPQLENLIFHGAGVDTMHRVLLASRPRYLQCSGGALLREHVQLSQTLSHVEWFKFHYPLDTHFDFLTFFQVLQHLPNLKILNVVIPATMCYSLRPQSIIPRSAPPVVTLPNLRMLSLDLWNDAFYSICTPPTLDYLGLSRFSNKITQDWDFLDRTDLSMTKSFLVTLYDIDSYLKYKVARSLIARITMGHDDDNDHNNSYQVFERFHSEISPITSSSVESHLVLPPKNTFNIELHNFRDIDTTLSHHLKKALNLVQLTLDYQSFKLDSDKRAVVSQLLNILDTITHLKVLRCSNFSGICGLLMTERNVPRLEQLTYHSPCMLSSTRDSDTANFVLKRLRMMKNMRFQFHCEPLKIIETRNFAVLSPQQIETVEEMGIQFIQLSELS